MTGISQPRRRIRTKLIWSSVLMSLVIILVFSLFNFVFVYTVEDTFFERLVDDEREFVEAAFERSGVLPEPRQPFIQILETEAQLPADIQEEFSREPNRPEYAGSEGRHYHLTYSNAPRVIIVAEVSEFLVVRKFRKGIFITLIVTALLLLCVSVVVALVLGNRLARPIESLANLFGTASPRDLPTGFAGDYPANEIGMLAEGMQEAVTRINAFIVREQDFTRDVSHELRTPVAVMKGALELLESTADSRQTELVCRMHNAVQMMEQSIEALLVIAREEVDTEQAPCELLPLIEHSVVANAGLLEGKEIAVDVSVASNLAVPASAGRLQILINNLISNAFQHTDSGQVTIGTHGEHTLVIADTGQGIEPAIQEEVFTQFVKGENSAGLGVGLSIVKRLCEQQGWLINLESSTAGTRIAITFR